MLTKMQIADELEAMGLGKRRQIANILDGLAKLAQEELADGNDFSVPGVAKVSWGYTSPRAKGALYKKGDSYVGFGGVTVESAEADSKERKEKIALKSAPAAQLKRLAPKGNDRVGQRKFLSTRAGKAIRARKG